MKTCLFILMGLILSFKEELIAQAPIIKWQQDTVTAGPDIYTEDFGNGYVEETIFPVAEELVCLIPAPNGSYAGLINTIKSNSDPKLVKFDAAGKLILAKSIPGNNCLVKASDGGYMALGIASDLWYDNTRSSNYILLTKIDEDGNKIWQEKYRGAAIPQVTGMEAITYSATAISMIATKDGGYLIGGQSDAPAGNDKSQNSRGLSDFWILKIKADGLIEWEKTIGGSENDVNVKVAQSIDGNYIIGGQSGSPVSGDKTEDRRAKPFKNDYWILKLNANNGNIIWQKTLGGSEDQPLTVVTSTADGGCIVGGQSSSPVSGDKTAPSQGRRDYWILKLAASGVVEWQKTLGGALDEALQSIVQLPDGGYILGGQSKSKVGGDKTVLPYGGDDFWIVKLSAVGNLDWQTAAGGTNDDRLSSIILLSDGEFIAGGVSYSGISGNKTVPVIGTRDLWMVKYGPCTSSTQDEKTICHGSVYNFNGTSISNPGIYNGTFTNIYGCDSTVALTLKFYPVTTPLVNVKDTILSSAGNYSDYQWLLNGNALNGAVQAVYHALKDGLYQLVVTTPDGCKDTSLAVKPVYKTNLFVPNVFTPNGDAKNDILKVFGNQVRSARLMIFNQWGQKVFETSDATQTGWDGRTGGKLQPVGVYIYALEVKLADGTTEKSNGTFSLIR